MGESPTPNAPPLPAALGEVIGAYRLTEVLGHGGMGCVYRGEHLRLGRSAAVKVMHAWVAEDARYTSRLQLEATLVNALRHPNIVDVLDFVQSEGPVRVACVMELLEGPTLAELLTTRRLRPDQALHAAHQLAEALAAVHAQGVVHRDVTPGNVLVVAPLDGDFRVSPCVKLLDFGVAKVTDRSVSGRTLTERLTGTPAYMAPEQLAAEEATAATDVYGLMQVLVEMLTGERLFADAGLAMLRRKLAGVARVALPAEVVGRPALEALIVAGLAGDPRARPWLDEIRPRLRELAALQGRGDATPPG
ncbi:MAG: serine/threonine-protein kinase [Myxococcota bacterium]